MEKMEAISGLSFEVITYSDFIGHIKDCSFLVDKSLMIAEFLGPQRAVPQIPRDDAIVFPSSSIPEFPEKRGPPEEGLLRKRLKTDTTKGHSRALIVRPRRFGKTFGLSMINDFLKMGDSIPSEQGRKLIFQQTQIWRTYPNFCEMNFAQHPVIFASFKVCPILVRVRHIKRPSSRTSRHRRIVSCVFR